MKVQEIKSMMGYQSGPKWCKDCKNLEDGSPSKRCKIGGFVVTGRASCNHFERLTTPLESESETGQRRAGSMLAEQIDAE